MSSYEPKVGDRVRVVLEGEITDVFDGGGFDLDDEYGIEPLGPQATRVVSVEKVRLPLPTTPGSVVQNGNGYYFLLGSKGWVSELGNEFKPQPDWDVIFDAGAV